MPNTIESYLYELKPVVDSSLWDKATSIVSKKVSKNQKEINKTLEEEEEIRRRIEEITKRNEKLERKKRELISRGAIAGKETGRTFEDRKLDEILSQLESSQDELKDLSLDNDLLKKYSGADLEFAKNTKLANENMLKAGSSIVGLLGVLTTANSKAMEILETSTKYSNKFVSGNSMFVDTNVRDYMLKYGVGSTGAQSIMAAEGALGIDASDYALLTEGQREAFDELMQHYQTGLNNINTEKLDKFNESLQEYQLRFKEFEMDIQLGIMKLFAESEPLQKLGDTVMDFLGSVTDILSSDAAQFAFDTFINFLNMVVQILSAPFKLLGGMVGNNTTNNTTTNNYTTNNYSGTSKSVSNPLSYQQSNTVFI